VGTSRVDQASEAVGTRSERVVTVSKGAMQSGSAVEGLSARWYWSNVFSPTKSYLLSVSGKWPDDEVRVGPAWETFPFSLPIIQTLGRLNLSSYVTLFVGESGSGKSTTPRVGGG
jgi:hypothetical protein